MQTTDGETSIEYDESAQTYRLSTDGWCDDSVTSTVVMAVSAITNTPPTDVDPIHRVVDPDALDDLYTSRAGGKRPHANGSTSFRFHECDIVVHATGDIEIRPLDDSEDATEEISNDSRFE